MIRHVAYAKAVLAGMAGAAVWEAVARLLILFEVPFFRIVDNLGAVALPHGRAGASWLVGMLLHVVVGAIWAAFYAYFFCSILPLRPALQGFLFAFVPMPLAICIMRPQLELMQQFAQPGDMPASGLFGLSGGLYLPLTFAVGHLGHGAGRALYAPCWLSCETASETERHKATCSTLSPVRRRVRGRSVLVRDGN